MQYRNLGQSSVKISAIGLGCMGMSHAYGHQDDTQSINTLHEALEQGINFWDTADFYGNGENEKLIAQVLKPNRDKIVIASKFGFKYQSNKDVMASNFDGSPAWMRQAIELSLQRLQVECIDLYYLHRVDPQIPVEESVGAMAELVKEGKVRYLGLSEASATSLRKANRVHPIAALQSEYSLLTRDVEPAILPVVRELGMTLVPFSPLGRGMFTDNFDSSTFEDGDVRFSLPRFQGPHLTNNQSLIKALAEFAQCKGVTVAQLALAWLINQGDDIVPIPGTKKIKYLQQNVKAVDVKLTVDEMAAIEAIIQRYPNTGERYTASALKLVNN